MYGCFDPYIIYGFKELDTDTDAEISREYFEKKVDNSIEIYASELIKFHSWAAVYGVVANLSLNGVCTVTDEQKKTRSKDL